MHKKLVCSLFLVLTMLILIPKSFADYSVPIGDTGSTTTRSDEKETVKKVEGESEIQTEEQKQRQTWVQKLTESIDNMFKKKQDDEKEIETKVKTALSNVSDAELRQMIRNNWKKFTNEPLEKEYEDVMVKSIKEHYEKELTDTAKKTAKNAFQNLIDKMLNGSASSEEWVDGLVTGGIETATNYIYNSVMEPLFGKIEEWGKDNGLIGRLVTGTVGGVLENYTINSFDAFAKHLEKLAGANSKEIAKYVNPNDGINLSWEMEKQGLAVVNKTTMDLVNDIMAQGQQKLADLIGGDVLGNGISQIAMTYISRSIQPSIDKFWLDLQKDMYNSRGINISAADLAEIRRAVGLDEYYKSIANMEGDSFYGYANALNPDEEPDDFRLISKEEWLKKIDEAAVEEYTRKMEQQWFDKMKNYKNQTKLQMADMIGDFAAVYAESLFGQLNQKIADFTKDFGKIGGTAIASIVKQIEDTAVDNIKEYVTKSLIKTFFSEDEVTKKMKFNYKKLKIDWGQVMADVVGDMLGDSVLAKLGYEVWKAFENSATGGVMSGPIPFERYATAKFLFGVGGGTPIPSLQAEAAKGFVNNLATAEAYYTIIPFFDMTDATFAYIPYPTIFDDEAYTIRELEVLDEMTYQYPGNPMIFSSLGPDFGLATSIAEYYPIINWWEGLLGNPGGLIKNYPTLCDAAYILCEMDQNVMADSYVQKALSWTSINKGIPYPIGGINDYSAIFLYTAAEEFNAFAIEFNARMLSKGIDKIVENKTQNAVARGIKPNDSTSASFYTFGPFKVDYIRAFTHYNLRGQENFGHITNMKIYDQDGNEIPQGSWNITYSEDTQNNQGRANTNDSNYTWPYPNEDFYITVNNYSGNPIRALGRIEITYDAMEVVAESYALKGTALEINVIDTVIKPACYPDYINVNKIIAVGVPIPAQDLLSVVAANKFYVDYTHTITLNMNEEKKRTEEGYEIIEFTTTGTTSISGFKRVSSVFGGTDNSKLLDSINKIGKSYGTVSSYSPTGSRFWDSLTAVYNIYNDANNKTPLLTSVNAVLSIYGHQDLMKYVNAASILTSQNANPFTKALSVYGMFDKSGKAMQIATILKDISDIKAATTLSKEEKQKLREQAVATLPEDVEPTEANIDERYKELLKEAEEKKRQTGVRNLTKNIASQVGGIYAQSAGLILDTMDSTKLTDEQEKEAEAMASLEFSGRNDYTQAEYNATLEKYRAKFKAENMKKSQSEWMDLLKQQSGNIPYGTNILDVINAAYNISNPTNTQSIPQSANTVMHIVADDKDIEKQQKIVINTLIHTISNILLEGSTDREANWATSLFIKAVLEGEKEDESLLDTYRQNIVDLFSMYGMNSEKVNDIITEIDILNNKDDITKGDRDTLVNKVNTFVDKDLEIDMGLRNKIGGLVQNYAEGKVKDYIKSTLEKEIDEMYNAAVEKRMATKKVKVNEAFQKVAEEMYTNDENSEGQAILSKLMDVVTKLTITDVDSMNKAILGSSGLDDVITVIDAYQTRASGSPGRFVDLTEEYVERAVMEDNTEYIEYSPKFQLTTNTSGTQGYFGSPADLGVTVGVAGVIWKDGHGGLENDYDGIRGVNANGFLESPIMATSDSGERIVERVKVRVYEFDKETGREICTAKHWVERNGGYVKEDAITYSDEGGYYYIEDLVFQGGSPGDPHSWDFGIEFEYDGQNYKTLDLNHYLAGDYGYAQEDLEEKFKFYAKKDPNNEAFDNNSKVIEDPYERQIFNDRFNEVVNGYAISKYASTYIPNTYNVGRTSDGKAMTPLTYYKKEGVSKLITLDNQGHVKPQFAMYARTTTIGGLTYPFDNTFTFGATSTTMLQGGNTVNYDNEGEYMYHINLGLIERTKADLAITQDVVNTTTTVNQKKEVYNYNARGILGMYDAKVMRTPTYQNGVKGEFNYTRELYKADYQFRIADYRVNDLNKLDRYEEKKEETKEVENLVNVKTKRYNEEGQENGKDAKSQQNVNGNIVDVWDLEERLFVKYKISIRNQSIMQWATVNEVVDYYDATYSLVTEDTFMDIQDEEGVPHYTQVAWAPFYERGNGEVGPVIWTESSKYGTNEITGAPLGFKNAIYTQSLQDFMLTKGEEIYLYITFEVDKKSDFSIKLGEKRNVAEISNYSTFAKGAINKDEPEGLIDKDSEPGNVKQSEDLYKHGDIYGGYEDDTDEAPVLNVKLYEETYGNNGRNIDGYVWDDGRVKILKSGQVIGDGLRQSEEDLITGVRVQLIEKIDDPITGLEYEYVWKEIYTSENQYTRVRFGGEGKNTANSKNNIETKETITANSTLGPVNPGQYKFFNYVAGNYIVRFIYGDTPKTYLTNGKEEKENQRLTVKGGGKNRISYNGQDFKSTTYQDGYNINEVWYDLGDDLQNNRFMSDAKDDRRRRLDVIDYSHTVQNDKAEIMASFDARADRNDYQDDRNYYDNGKHKELRDNTWMFADTARFNVQGEYNTTEVSGLEDHTYRIRNIDFGLEQRPETKIELKKEIIGIKVTLSSGEVIVDTANGVSKNVNWVSNKKNIKYEDKDKKETENISARSAYKRLTKQYEYKQGKIHIYMDEEIMQGARVQVDYKITITNDSEIDYTGIYFDENGNAKGDLGIAYYQGRTDYETDKIVTTKVDKIIDYVDNSLVFRYEDNIGKSRVAERYDEDSLVSRAEDNNTNWQLVENMTDDFAAKTDAEKKEFEKAISKRKAELEKEGKTLDQSLSNTNTLIYMQGVQGYLNPSLEFVQTKSARTEKEPITQVIVSKSLENIELEPQRSEITTETNKQENDLPDTAIVYLTLFKTLSPNDDKDTLSYRNVAEILQMTNTVGRRDMDALTGNQDPDVKDVIGYEEVMPREYDADVTEQVIITPPTGENKSTDYVLITAGVLAVIAIGIGIVIIVRKRK